MTDIEKNRDLVSALVDGQLRGEAFAQAVQVASTDADGRATWHAYQCVGDVLRSADLARSSASSEVFLARLRERLHDEPSPLTRVAVQSAPGVGAGLLPQVAAVPSQAANAGWRMAAICASLVAVASIGWNALSLWGAPAGVAAQQLAVASPAVAPASAVSVAENSAEPAMIRDARLDELLAAHKQFGGVSALQMPAGFVRNATFEGVAR
ncbi:MAG TPA: sigma-E factor negative regulatory protein [Burkholderiaceae bacterium]